MKEKINNQLKSFRQDMKITQEEIGKAVGVSRQSVIAIERGKYVPSLPLAFKLAKFFQVKIEDLFQLEEENYG